jgi:hypothetical protein
MFHGQVNVVKWGLQGRFGAWPWMLGGLLSCLVVFVVARAPCPH